MSSNPISGDLIKETGGIRKLRWAAKGKGKSGGVRVIYYNYHNISIPLFMLTVFGKERKKISPGPSAMNYQKSHYC